MITIYKKCEKTIDNLGGIIEINNIEELDKPFLLCLSAQDNVDKSIYGLIREGAQAARIYTTQEQAGGFKINEFPVDFLGLRFVKDDKFKTNYHEIVEKFIYPYLIGNGKKNVAEIRKKARRINLMTYCDGTMTYEGIEKKLEEKLKETGFTQEDIDSILSQISLVAIGTMADTSNFKATTTTFVDINDSEITTPITENYRNLLSNKQQESFYGTLTKKNNVLYIYEGRGNHKLKEYLSKGCRVKPALCSVISKFLEKSIENEKQDGIVEISSNDTLEQLRIYADETKKSEDLLGNLDAKVSYDNAPKYTKEEANLRYQLDISYGELQKTKLELQREETQRKQTEQKLTNVTNNIKKYSSETAFYQILVSAGVWQPPIGRDVFNEQSDKNIREAYEKMLDIQELPNKHSR